MTPTPTPPHNQAEIRPADPASLDLAARILSAGGLVAIPTETVYGLAADATNDDAVTRIFEAKGRPSFNPLISHVSSIEMAAKCAVITPLARALIERFWPGPLTLVLEQSASCPVSRTATAGLETIALRMPKTPASIEIIERVGRPLAAPSANPSERLSPTTAAHVSAFLGDRIDLIIDGGTCSQGIESTIVAVQPNGCILLRPGAIARAQIEQITGPLGTPNRSLGILAPGMMRRHYAPRARLRLDAVAPEIGEAFLGFGPPPPGVTPTLNLSSTGDTSEAASNLFVMLHQLDHRFDAIAVAAIPDEGLGEGIVDRLKRAAARSEKDGV